MTCVLMVPVVWGEGKLFSLMARKPTASENADNGDPCSKDPCLGRHVVTAGEHAKRWGVWS